MTTDEVTPETETSAADDEIALEPANEQEEGVAQEAEVPNHRTSRFRSFLNRGAQIAKLEEVVATLQAANEQLTEEVHRLEVERANAVARVDEITELLDAELEKIEGRVSDGVAEQVAAAGFEPANLPAATAGEDMTAEEAKAEFATIDSPEERAAFFRENKALLVG